jgi:hypothetical protein
MAFGALRHQQQPLKSIHFIYFSMLFMVVMATLLTTVIFVPTVSQLFFWRLAPFVSLLAFILIIIALLNHGTTLLHQRPLNSFNLGLTALASYYLHKAGLSYPLAILAALSLVAIMVFILKQTVIKQLKPALPLTVLLLLAASVLRMPSAYQRSNIFTDTTNPAKQALFAWIKQHTPQDSQFIIPPGFSDFRLKSQRAIVVDWKSPPIMPDEVMLWYKRIQDVSGLTEVKTHQQANQHYGQMDKARLAKLKDSYAIDYAVFSNAISTVATLGEVVYQNNKYTVVAINNNQGQSLRDPHEF